MLYNCSICGETHEDWPAITFNAPEYYYQLSEVDKIKYVSGLNDDSCILKYEDQTDFFIRAVLFQKVNDHCCDLQYGIWVSLSEENFMNYQRNFFSDIQGGTYFGFLCTRLPGYDTTLSIKTYVVLQNDRKRPEVIPHQDQMENAFVKDYYEGISKEEAERIITDCLNK
jgi:hypothetical protein